MSKKVKMFWWWWLQGATVGVILFGLAFLFLPDLMLKLFNWLLYSNSPDSSPFNTQGSGLIYIIFAHRVLGAVMIGWGVSLWIIIVGLWRLESSVAWYAVAFSLVSWFVPDTLFSLSSGFAGNAILNFIFIVVFAIPILATYKYFTNPIKKPSEINIR